VQSRPANFLVDPRLATLLGETYRSTEQALKELVDNAWDADAPNVWITLPGAMTLDPITVRDDGTGMMERELRQEYLKVARDRRASKGERTPGKHRLVKGRKGIGKFAGLIIAEIMTVETSARGQTTCLTIPKQELLSSTADLEKLPLPLTTVACDAQVHGTTITLSRLHQHLAFPNSERLKQLLMLDYGRETDFTILVNDQPLGVADISGESFTREGDLPDVGKVKLHFKITEEKQPTKNAGVAIRVGGTIVSPPEHFGLENAEDLPKGLLRRVYGEVEADGLKDDLTAAGWGILENSKGYAALSDWVQSSVREQLDKTFRRDISLQRARLQQEINRRLAQVPAYRRGFAHTAMERIMQRFYGEPEEQVRPIINVVLDALERDEYRTVLEQIDAAQHQDVAVLAVALAEFGVLETGRIAHQAQHRLRFLDELDKLITSPDTKETAVHTALATNLWVFGAEFSLVVSNTTLANTLKKYTDEKFTGPRAQHRPDLLLLTQLGQRYKLVEFKRPSHTLDRRDVSQAEQYRDDLISRLQPIDIMVLGKEFDPRMLVNMQTNVTLASYTHLISRARAELQWLLGELTRDAASTETST
jgi:Histidine kinase-, DNA gyrase B-, and HSP90-like ATPase